MVMSAERFIKLPPAPKALAPVACAYAFKEPQPVGHGLGCPLTQAKKSLRQKET